MRVIEVFRGHWCFISFHICKQPPPPFLPSRIRSMKSILQTCLYISQTNLCATTKEFRQNRAKQGSFSAVKPQLSIPVQLGQVWSPELHIYLYSPLIQRPHGCDIYQTPYLGSAKCDDCEELRLKSC